MEYEALVTLDRDEDGIWVAECPSIPGCVSQGKTKTEALKNIKEAVALCIEVRAERGLPLTIETRGRSSGLMPALPVMSGRKTVRVFEKLGWEIARQRGSHIILVKEGEIATLSIPDHKEIAKGTLRSLIRSAGLTVEAFVRGM